MTRRHTKAYTLIEIICVLFIVGALFGLLTQQLPKYSHTLRPQHLKTLTQSLVTQAQSLAMTQPENTEELAHSYIYLTPGETSQLSLNIGTSNPAMNQFSFPKHIQASMNSKELIQQDETPVLVWEFDAEGKCITPENTLTLTIRKKKSLTFKVSPWGILSQVS